MADETPITDEQLAQQRDGEDYRDLDTDTADAGEVE